MKVHSNSCFQRIISFVSGLALATSITETLCRSKAFVILATHFQQLTSVGYIYRNVANYHFNVIYNDKIDINDSTNRTKFDQLKEQNTIIYSYTLRPGICKDLHYGKGFFVFSLKRAMDMFRYCISFAN
jgi:DNA mismatch repair ATPase MutS